MRKVRHIAVLLVSLSLFLGCDEAVQAVKTERKPFTIYGFLNPRADTQALRVFPIDETLEIETRDRIDGILSSKNQASGEILTWNDSLVIFDDINQGHVFHKNFRPEYDTPYELLVSRSDGINSTVTTTTPPDTRAELSIVRDTGTDIEANLDWTGAPRVQSVEVRYNLLFNIEDRFIRTFYLVEKTATELSEDNWNLSIPLDDDAREIFRELNRPIGAPLTLCELQIRSLITNEEWYPPNGDYDPNVLVQPGTFSNVENGFGFVGAGYFDEIVWTPDSTQIQGAGFHFDPECYRN